MIYYVLQYLAKAMKSTDILIWNLENKCIEIFYMKFSINSIPVFQFQDKGTRTEAKTALEFDTRRYVQIEFILALRIFI